MIAAISRLDERIQAARVQWVCSRSVLVLVAEPTTRPLQDIVGETPFDGGSLVGHFKLARAISSASDGSGNSLLVIGLEPQFIWFCHRGEFWVASQSDDSANTSFVTRDHGMAAAIKAHLGAEVDAGVAETVSSRYLLPKLIPPLSSELVPLPMAGQVLRVGCQGRRPSINTLEEHAMMSIRLREAPGETCRFVFQ